MRPALRFGSGRSSKWAMLAVVLVVALAAGGSAFAQCAMCEGSAAAGSDGGAAYNSSTLFMLAVPYLLLGGIGGYVVWSFRRTRPSPPPAQSDPGDPAAR